MTRAVTGKPVGGDLLEGKPTPLLARAVAGATPAQLAVLDRVGAADLDADDIAAIQQVIVDTGALDQLEAAIERLSDEAIDALATIDHHRDRPPTSWSSSPTTWSAAPVSAYDSGSCDRALVVAARRRGRRSHRSGRVLQR